MTADDRIRYARHLALPQLGEAAQQRLQDSTALVIGLGGLGSVASLYLANAGVGQLMINDFDRVDRSNLPRQILFDEADVGEFKVTAAAARLGRYNPGIRINSINERLNDAALSANVSQADIVLDCTDNFASRCAVNRVCHATGTLLVTGAAIRLEGQLAVFRHDLQQDGPCYECLYSSEDDNLEDCAGQGILAPVVGMVGCMMATETVKLLAGLGSAFENRLWAYDAESGTTKTIGIKARPDCPVCGSVQAASAS